MKTDDELREAVKIATAIMNEALEKLGSTTKAHQCVHRGDPCVFVGDYVMVKGKATGRWAVWEIPNEGSDYAIYGSSPMLQGPAVFVIQQIMDQSVVDRFHKQVIRAVHTARLNHGAVTPD